MKRKGFSTELWYPATDFSELPNVKAIPLYDTGIKALKRIINEKSLDPLQDIIITHGSWKFATRWGGWLKKRGFKWIYVPQGMLEPWAMQQKRLKKKLYFTVIEKKIAAKADVIRAVSLTEMKNLQTLFPNSLVQFIPNGVAIDEGMKERYLKMHEKTRYLFLSRLHHKKNVVALAKAWLASTINNDPAFELLIAGPDQGELEKLNSLLRHSSNMKYIGSVYGAQKRQILDESDFYILPSFSEGLPSALLEAMGAGVIPIITEGCNIPDVFNYDLGARITTEKENITKVLEETSKWNFTVMQDKSKRNMEFISHHYSINAITSMQLELLNRVLPAATITSNDM